MPRQLSGSAQPEQMPWRCSEPMSRAMHRVALPLQSPAAIGRKRQGKISSFDRLKE